MKAFSIIAKLFAVLATAVGAIVLLATYGEKIVAWCKKTMDSFIEVVDDEDELEDEDIEVEVEVVEEIEDAEPVEEVLVELADETEETAPEVVADEADFEG